MFAKQFEGERFDVGDKWLDMKTSIEFGLEHPEIKDEPKTYMIELGKKLEGTLESNKVVVKGSKNLTLKDWTKRSVDYVSALLVYTKGRENLWMEEKNNL